MNTNTAITPALPSNCTPIVSSKGNVIGQRFTFGTYSASMLKAQLKAQGHKGRKLTELVNQALRDEASQRAVIHAASAQELLNRGLVPDFIDLKAKFANVRWVKPAAVKASKAETTAKAAVAAAEAKAAAAEAKLNALMAKLGVTPEEIAALPTT